MLPVLVLARPNRDQPPTQQRELPDQAFPHEFLEAAGEDPVDCLWRWIADVFLDVGTVDEGGV